MKRSNIRELRFLAVTHSTHLRVPSRARTLSSHIGDGYYGYSWVRNRRSERFPTERWVLT